MIAIDNIALVKTKVNCIIHYMCILPKWRRKGYEKYLMGKLFASVLELDHLKIFSVTRLIHDYTPTHCDEPVSNYTKKELQDQIREDIVNDRT